ncbi:MULTISPECIES: maltokinase N-terminal cap-like domain-containing protein [unclassified Streptomyces]|uniref:maltokinase N-terminal cap-like domain-containing protein n=1 Tax=unclassified Streptomyces TaxID=2593676 RepID=UPI00202481E3|nr:MULTISPECIES: phosphotransferase [unclassified Streptomyces]MCX4548087.1 phosphotransferase [Streptomyces sp. NBC_01500]
MSKAASTRNTSRSAGASGPLGLLASLTPLLHEWLPRQRWFAGKGRPVSAFSLVSATELLPVGAAPGLLHLLVRAQQEPSAGSGPTGDCYQLLLGVRTSLPPRLAAALVGRAAAGPLAGLVVYDALLDPRLTALLLERLRAPGRLGALRFDRDPAVVIPAGLVARPLGAEQSNTSLVYGDTFILKVFRRVHPGSNPDLELPLALAQAGCARVPAPVAWYETTEPEPATLGVLQPFLFGSEDGWQLALHALADGHDFTAGAHALGRATAEVHGTLASALPTAVLRKRQIQHLAAEMTERLETTARAVPALAPYAAGLRTAFDALADLGHAGRVWAAQRIHGDLHLGQSLRARDGEWSVIDFEGEPARPLAERTRPQPVVRDVAGMLRSFDYAARSHRPWSPQWATGCRDAYCEGYAAVSGADPRAEPELLRAYETDKAVYEVLYEARNRPDWLPVPMAAIKRLSTPFPTRAPKLPRRPPQ